MGWSSRMQAEATVKKAIQWANQAADLDRRIAMQLWFVIGVAMHRVKKNLY